MGAYNLVGQPNGSLPQQTLTKTDKVTLRHEPKDYSLMLP
jgi:hypothetical protein